MKNIKSDDYEQLERLVREQKFLLIFACSIGDQKLVVLMIKHGVNVDFVGENGKNALTTAYKIAICLIFSFWMEPISTGNMGFVFLWKIVNVEKWAIWSFGWNIVRQQDSKWTEWVHWWKQVKTVIQKRWKFNLNTL